MGRLASKAGCAKWHSRKRRTRDGVLTRDTDKQTTRSKMVSFIISCANSHTAIDMSFVSWIMLVSCSVAGNLKQARLLPICDGPLRGATTAMATAIISMARGLPSPAGCRVSSRRWDILFNGRDVMPPDLQSSAGCRWQRPNLRNRARA